MTDEAPRAPRSNASILFSATPIVTVAALSIAVGLLVLLVWKGGKPTGERVTFALRGTCAADEWQAIVASRMTEIGLGQPALEARDARSIRITATLPGIEGDRDSIPRLLARTGLVELGLGADVLVRRPDLTNAHVTVDEAGQPYTALVLTPDASARVAATGADRLVGTIDGIPTETWQSPGTLRDRTIRLVTNGADNRARMLQAVDAAIVLNHGPLPCAVEAEPATSEP